MNTDNSVLYIRKFDSMRDLNQILLIEVDRFSDPMSKMLLEFLIKKYGDKYYYIIQKKNSDVVLGYLFAGIEDKNEIHIYTIAVRTEEEGKGYGQKLLTHLIEIAKVDKIRKIRLEVNENNRKAYQIYKKYNFNQIGIAENYYDGKDNALIMIYNIE